jgi:hypothetical protein
MTNIDLALLITSAVISVCSFVITMKWIQSEATLREFRRENLDLISKIRLVSEELRKLRTSKSRQRVLGIVESYREQL